MSQLQQHLFQLASTAVAVGLSLTPTSAHAFQLSVFGQTITNGGSGDSCSSNNEICFSRQRITVGTTTFNASGRLIRGSVSFPVGPGIVVNGTILNFTCLTSGTCSLPAAANIGSSDASNIPFITFENTFMFSSTGSVVAKQILKGSFEPRTGSTSIGNDNITFTGTVNGTTIATQIANPASDRPFDFERNASKTFPGITNPKLRGELTRLTLRSGDKLILPNSGCIGVFDQNISDDDFEAICNRVAGVPEPTSAWSILALGALGATSWLTHKRKFLQHDKD